MGKKIESHQYKHTSAQGDENVVEQGQKCHASTHPCSWTPEPVSTCLLLMTFL